jgi:hypothetical protein
MYKSVKMLLIAFTAIMALIIGNACALDGDAFGSEGGDVGSPQLAAHVAGDMLTIDNTGTAPSLDIGGAQIGVGNELVGILPYTFILNGYPFTFGKYCHPPANWSKTIKLARPLASGEKFVVTNGIGIYAKGVAQ